MKTRRILIYTSFAVSMLMLQFGPYRNNELLRKMEDVRLKIQLAQKVRDRLEILNTMSIDEISCYKENDQLANIVMEYLSEEKAYLAT